MNIEIKPAMGAALETGRVVGELTAKLYADTIVKDGFKQENISHACPLFSSFERDALRGAMETAPDIPRGFLIDEIPDDWRDVLEEMQCVSLHTNWKRMTPEIRSRSEGLGLLGVLLDAQRPGEDSRTLPLGRRCRLHG